MMKSKSFQALKVFHHPLVKKLKKKRK